MGSEMGLQHDGGSDETKCQSNAAPREAHHARAGRDPVHHVAERGRDRLGDLSLPIHGLAGGVDVPPRLNEAWLAVVPKGMVERYTTREET